MNLTVNEVETLADANTDEAWNAACDAIKEARDGKYPDDWFALVIAGGMQLSFERRAGRGRRPSKVAADLRDAVPTLRRRIGDGHAVLLVEGADVIDSMVPRAEWERALRERNEARQMAVEMIEGSYWIWDADDDNDVASLGAQQAVMMTGAALRAVIEKATKEGEDAQRTKWVAWVDATEKQFGVNLKDGVPKPYNAPAITRSAPTEESTDEQDTERH